MFYYKQNNPLIDTVIALPITVHQHGYIMTLSDHLYVIAIIEGHIGDKEYM